MKEKLVGTRLGNALLDFSDWRKLRLLPFSNPEQALMVANDLLARKLVTQLCPPDGVFVDVGAHIGSILAAVHDHDPSIKIIAIEADAMKAAKLRAHFDYATLHAVAVGETEGTAAFHRVQGASGYSSLATPDARADVVEVPVARLDDLLLNTAADLLKIDVEGAELGALRGGAATIARSRPVIMFECVGTAPNSLGYCAADLWQWFDAAGYVVFAPHRLAHTAPPLALDSFLDGNHYPFTSYNYFAVPSEKKAEVRDRARQIVGLS